MELIFAHATRSSLVSHWPPVRHQRTTVSTKDKRISNSLILGVHPAHCIARVQEENKNILFLLHKIVTFIKYFFDLIIYKINTRNDCVISTTIYFLFCPHPPVRHQGTASQCPPSILYCRCSGGKEKYFISVAQNSYIHRIFLWFNYL